MTYNIIVTGSPGVGKTMFSIALSKRTDYEYIPMDDLIISNKLYLEYDDKRNSYVADIKKCTIYFREFYDKGGFIFDSHLSHLIIPKHYVYKCIVLRCSPYILWERLEKKKYQREKILENVQSEILDIILNECLEKYGENMLICIDVSNGVDRKLDLVLQLLEKNANLIERVDWLSLIYEKGDLHRFFPT